MTKYSQVSESPLHKDALRESEMLIKTAGSTETALMAGACCPLPAEFKKWIYIWIPFLLCVQITSCTDEGAFRYKGHYINNVKLVVCCVFVIILEGCGVVNCIITSTYKISFLERYFGKH